MPAASTELNLLLTAKDNASKDLNKLKGNVSGLGKAFGDMAKIAGGFVLAKGLLQAPSVIAGFVSSASNLNETLSKSNTVFRDNAKEIEAWADGAAKNFGQSKQQALEAAGNFGNMFTQLGIGTDKAADMSKQMVELASDFASFHNADITEVLTAQQAAFRGEYDALQRFVPTINAAAVEQKALQMGLAKTTIDATKVKAAQLDLTAAQAKAKEVLKQYGAKSLEAQKANLAVTKAQEALAAASKGSTGELSAQAKALAAQALMLEGAGDAMGDFDRTSDGLANRQRILAARFDDLKANIGQQLLPVVVALAGVLLDKVFPAVEGLANVITRELQGAIAKLAPVVNDFIIKFTPLFESLAKNKDVITGLAGGAIAALTVAIGALVVTVVSAAAPFVAIGLAIAGVGIIISKLGIDFGAIGEAIRGWLQEKIPIAVAFLRAEFDKLKVYFDSDLKPAFDNIVTAAKAVVDFIVTNWPTIMTIVQPIIDQIVSRVKLVYEVIANLIALVVDLIQGDWAGAWQNAKDIFGAFWTYIKESVGQIGDLFRAVIPLAEEGAKALGKAIANGIISGINGLLKKLSGTTIIPAINVAGVDISPEVKIPPLPEIQALAKGGIVTGPMLAMIGDNKSHKEAVIPLDSNGRSSIGGPNVNLYVSGSILSERDVIRIVRDALTSGGFPELGLGRA